MRNGPIVILTALDLEYSAVRAHLKEVGRRSHQSGTLFESGVIADTACRVVLGLTGKGNQASAVIATRAMEKFEPRAVIFCGIAGRLWPSIALGDVVVASHVYAYHGATSEDDGLKARPRVWEIPHECDQIAHHLSRTGVWARRLPEGHLTPAVRFGPVAAGEVVLDSVTSAESEWIRRHYNDAVAVEMEGAGLAQAAQLHRSLPALVIRGISDRADGTKVRTDGDNWQPRAAASAAAFAIALAEELGGTQGSGDTRRQEEGDIAVPHQTGNIAQGNAQVGVQAGTIHGGVSIGAHGNAVPADPQQGIAELRAHLDRAFASGEVDGVTYAAAKQELDAVAAELPPRDDAARNRIMLALRRMRGLLLDWTDLASKITALLTMLRDAR